MACTCRKRTRGRYANGTVTVIWGAKSECERGAVEFPPEFVSLESDGPSQEGSDVRHERDEQIALKGGGVQLCCVTYTILWQVTGLAPGDIFTVKSFSMGDDSWGPFDSQVVPPGGNATGGNKVLQVCKEDADCELKAIGKFVFEKRGPAPAQPVGLGSVGDIKLCKLS